MIFVHQKFWKVKWWSLTQMRGCNWICMSADNNCEKVGNVCCEIMGYIAVGIHLLCDVLSMKPLHYSIALALLLLDVALIFVAREYLVPACIHIYVACIRVSDPTHVFCTRYSRQSERDEKHERCRMWPRHLVFASTLLERAIRCAHISNE